MGLDDLTVDEIIEEIKKKKAKYSNKSYLFFEDTKLSPYQIVIALKVDAPPEIQLYTKLLSILKELNDNEIYLEVVDNTLQRINTKDYDSEAYKAQLHLLEAKKKNPSKVSKETSMKQQPLNQILYGPPGTGKTYNTINKALEIIDGKVPKNRNDAKERYDELRELGQIEFITFHQSYGYEEFVEGIKADLDSGDIKYILEDGIFKKLVKKALQKKSINLHGLDFSKYISINQKFKTLTGNEFEVVDVNSKIKVKNSQNKEYSLSRESILEYLEEQNFDDTKGHYSYQPIIAKEIFDKLEKSKFEDNRNNNYILIIDEINRGNISKIFGELITLIEPSKRIGKKEEIKLTLPNSKESFGVPSNLYIIGTMNTADRSIAQIDTALRRRFEFVEMMPKPELIVDSSKKPIVIDNIEVQKVLKAINERIEHIYDREHTIGHSYFIPLIETPTKYKLDEIFKVNIIPLLAEYFYGDWADIIEVLNDNGFIEEKKSTYTTKSNRGNKVYQVNSEFTVEAYQKIYNTQND